MPRIAQFHLDAVYRTDRQPGLVDGPALWRSLRLWQLRSRSRPGRLSHRSGAGGHVFGSVWHQLLRHGFQRAEVDQARSGFEAATQVRAHNLPTFADTVPARHMKAQLSRGRPPTGKFPEAGGGRKEDTSPHVIQ